MKTAILGASGYAGGELIKLIDAHPEFDLVYMGAHSHAGGVLGDVHPQLPRPDRPLQPIESELLQGVELCFLGLPHGASAHLGHGLAEAGVKVVDLGSDFRLDTPERYRTAYGGEHPLPGELGRWRYGLPELFSMAGADRVASPGCYPTAVLLAAAPLVKAGLMSSIGMVADCLSGVSGAGRALKEELLFGAIDEGVRAYGVTTHRHRPEIEMGLDKYVGGGHSITFTPHLVPMQRGILATVTGRASGVAGRYELLDALTAVYVDGPFVEVIDQPPQTRWVVGSNRALVTAYLDDRTDSVIAMCAIDNLLKGAAGQAVQAANLICGLDEGLSLPLAGWMP